MVLKIHIKLQQQYVKSSHYNFNTFQQIYCYLKTQNYDNIIHADVEDKQVILIRL